MHSPTKNNPSILIRLIGSLLLLLSFQGKAQQLNYTLSRDYLWEVDRSFNDTSSRQQTFVKPYRYAEIQKLNDSTVLFPTFFSRSKHPQKEQQKGKQFVLTALPILTGEIGYDAGKNGSSTNEAAVGVYLMSNVGKRFSFALKGLGGLGKYSSEVDSVIAANKVVPGIGYAYDRHSSDSLHPSYAWNYFSGYISWSPNKIFNIQAGQDKHFWGDGYRSLFLSDAAAPYPFLKISTTIWHLYYVNLYTIMKDATAPSGFKKDWLTKYATFHYLGWNATKRIQVGLFESIVWQGSDSTRHRGYDVNYLNPVMFFRPTEYSLGSSDNAFVGMSFKIKLFKRQQLYGQVLLDEFVLHEVLDGKGWWGNKQALQGGFKCFDLFKIPRLNFQTEINYIRPYVYAHGSVQQNYGQMNQPLAHPLGANLTESVNFINYRIKRWFLEARFSYCVYGADSAGTDYGSNVFVSYSSRPQEYGNYTGQGFNTTLIQAGLRAAYILDPHMNLKAEAGFYYRIKQSEFQSDATPVFFVGLRTDLSNLYRDY